MTNMFVFELFEFDQHTPWLNGRIVEMIKIRIAADNAYCELESSWNVFGQSVKK